MKKIYKGIVEGNVIRLEKQIGLPVGTQILVLLKTLYKDEQEDIKDRQMKLPDTNILSGQEARLMRCYSNFSDLIIDL